MATTKWVLDPTHSEIGFKIKHLMISNVSGSFTKFDVQAQTAGEDFSTATVTATIDVSSVYTNNSQRDEHLQKDDFFDTEKHPSISFTSTGVEKTGDDSFVLQGELTIKEVTKPVKLDVEFSDIVKDPWGNERAGFSISGKINRKQWGIGAEAIGPMLGEDLKLSGEIQLVKVVEQVLA